MGVFLAVGAARLRATAIIYHLRLRQIHSTGDSGSETEPNGIVQSVARMTAQEKLTRIQTAFETTEKHDFVSPLVSVDSIRQRERQELEAAQSYLLHQAFPTVQNLVPLCNAKGPSYTIRLDTVGSFLKPRPHMLITENAGGLDIAEIKFQVRGYDATMIYKNGRTSQKLALHNSEDQRFGLLINGKPHAWHPLGPSKSVFELTREANKRVALFVYAEGMAERTASTLENHLPFQKQKIGEVRIIEDFSREPIALQQTLFSAVVVVEQEKRRATSVATWVLPPQTKSHSSERRRSA